MTLNELKTMVDHWVEKGHGDLEVVYGDCNGYFRAGDADLGYVEDIDTYHMEPGTTDTGTLVFRVEE